MAGQAGRAALLVFVAALLQVSVLASIRVAGGSPDLLLVAVVAIALLRGPIYGAAAGFLGGLLADTATLETLGLTSLVLTVTGYWIGRYGETTGRDRRHAPLLAVLAGTGLYAVAVSALHFVLGADVPGPGALARGLAATVVFNAVLAAPVYAVSRRFLAPPRRGRMREVSVAG